VHEICLLFTLMVMTVGDFIQGWIRNVSTNCVQNNCFKSEQYQVW